MKLKIFGKLTEIFNTDEYYFSLENNISIAELKLMLDKEFPRLKETTFLVAVDGLKADNNQLISDTSEIALLPPYSGG
ncbi:MoaD/ThiS family protein [Epilithonimonas sp.]|uniref:MoaD/ThiS family protein n=1 Tax=Epilithonimonas sp. TaxID=2894511 RepID=UPI0035B39702